MFEKKKLLSVFLTLCLTAMMFTPISAYAAITADFSWYEGTADGSELNPYLISDADDLAGLAVLVNTGTPGINSGAPYSFQDKFIKVDAEIDLSAISDWQPIGTLDQPFRGTFDGNDQTVSGLTISNTAVLNSGQSVSLGLFGTIGPEGEVKDLTLSNASITISHSVSVSSNANSYVGGISGMNEGNIENCAVFGTFDVSGVDIKVGGITGTNSSDSGSNRNTAGSLKNNTSDCIINASCSYQLAHVGGIAGASTRATGTIEKCSSEGTITVTGAAGSNCSPCAGGLVGYTDRALITDSDSSCDIEIKGYIKASSAGGLVGEARSTTLQSSSSSGNVKTTGGDSSYNYMMACAGGLVGVFAMSSGNSAVIQDCYSTGDASATISSGGHLAYAMAGGSIGYAYYFGGPIVIETSFSTGDATATGADDSYAFAGGFAAYLRGADVDQCFAKGSSIANAGTLGYTAAGGFVGYFASNTTSQPTVVTTVNDCYSTGDSSADSANKEFVGGLVGMLDGTASAITSCYSLGNAELSHSDGLFYAGGSVGRQLNGTLTDCYYVSMAGITSGIGTGSAIVTRLSKDAMTAASVLSGEMSGLKTVWMKRTNTGTECYYPELSVFGASSDSVIQTISKNSVTTLPTGSSANPTSVTFDLNTADVSPGHYADVKINLTLNGNTLDNILLNGVGIGALNYTISNSVVTIKKEYLSTLGVGAHNFTFDMSAGSDIEISVNIVNSTVSSSPNSGSGKSKSDNGDKTVIYLNGEPNNIGTTESTTVNGQTIITVTPDKAILEQKLKTLGTNATVVIPITTKTDVVAGQLQGDIIQRMENQSATLEIQTPLGSYSLEAGNLNIGNVAARLGLNVPLSDVTISVQIKQATSSDAKVIQDAANNNHYTVIAPAVEYSIVGTYGGKSVAIDSFKGFVQRTIPIPDGVDPKKITTGVVVRSDGSSYHVPTVIKVIDGKYYAIINSITNSLYTVVWHPLEFKDVVGYWAQNSINNMGSRMVVTGIEENLYEPKRDITRAEFAAIIVRALGLTTGEGKTAFTDVPSSKWYAKYIGTATEYGVIKGYNSAKFGPNDSITREQAMTMIARAMDIAGLKVSKTSDISSYQDAGKISPYALDGVKKCISTGVVAGRTNVVIAPKENITRAETAVITERLLQKSGLIN